MRKPGWYPDPRGGFLLRYFDGTQWSDRVRALPDAAERVDATYLPHRWGGSPAFWITAAVLTGLLLPIVAFFLVPRPPELPPVPAPTGTMASATPTPSGNNSCSGRTYVGLTAVKPTTDQRLYGQEISAPLPSSPGWKRDGGLWFEIGDAQSASRPAPKGTKKFDDVQVGAISALDAETASPEDATQFLIDCQLNFLTDKTGYKEVLSEKFEVDGMTGWRRRIHVDFTPASGATGAILETIVLDSPSERNHAVLGWKVYDGDDATRTQLEGLPAQIKKWSR